MKKIELQKIIKEEIFNLLPINEQLQLQTYVVLAENIDINNSYSYDKIGKGWFEFTDSYDIKHFERIIFENDRYEIKFGFYNPQTKKLDYTRPKIYSNGNYDEKIFNTHLKILLKELLPYFFKNLNDEKLYLPALDIHRYRLYKIAINKLIDNDKYDLEYHPDKNLIILSQKK